MKKLFAIILAAIMLLALASCGAGKPAESEKTSDKETEATAPATEEATESETEKETEPAVPLEEAVEAFLDKYLCVTHGKLDIMFNYAGASFTQENIAAVIREAAGLGEDVEIKIGDDDFEGLFEGYQGSGDGGGGVGVGFVWPAPVVVTFTNSSTGETVEKKISFSFRKCLPSSEIWPKGVMGTCPEDADETMKNVYPQLKTVEISEENPTFTGYTGEYTAEAIEAYFRELTGLSDEDAYGFVAVGFDPETKGESFFPLFFSKNAPDGRFDAVWVETAF